MVSTKSGVYSEGQGVLKRDKSAHDIISIPRDADLSSDVFHFLTISGLVGAAAPETG